MATTTIRVDTETHERLRALSDEADASLTDTVRDAAEALRRQRFGDRVRAQYTELRSDPDSWADYLAEAEVSHVTDGLD